MTREALIRICNLLDEVYDGVREYENTLESTDVITDPLDIIFDIIEEEITNSEIYKYIENDNIRITLEDDISLIQDPERPLRIYAYVKDTNGRWSACQDRDLITTYPKNMPDEYYQCKMEHVFNTYLKYMETA